VVLNELALNSTQATNIMLAEQFELGGQVIRFSLMVTVYT
jgi:hypothetical protein